MEKQATKKPNKAIAILAHEIGIRLHDNWRKTSGYTDRWKDAKSEDQEFFKSFNGKFPPYIRQKEDGSYQIDIQNASFDQLSPSAKFENAEAGKVVADIIHEIDTRTIVDVHHVGYQINDLGKFHSNQSIGTRIHEKWLERNGGPEVEWIKAQGMDKPFDELSKELQDKDLDHFRIAKEVYKELTGSEIVDIGHTSDGKVSEHDVKFDKSEPYRFSEKVRREEDEAKGRGSVNSTHHFGYCINRIHGYAPTNAKSLDALEKELSIPGQIKNTLKSIGQKLSMTAEQLKSALGDLVSENPGQNQEQAPPILKK